MQGCWWSNPGLCQLDTLDTTRENAQPEEEDLEGGEEEGMGERGRMRDRYQAKEMGRFSESVLVYQDQEDDGGGDAINGF